MAKDSPLRQPDEQDAREKETLKQINRSYQALSETLRAKLAAKNEADLLNRVTQVIKACCQYKYVWFGYCDEDEERSVRPAAYSEDTAEFAQRIKVSWGDNSLGQGAVGKSIRLRKPVVFDNVLADPDFSPWRDIALKYGFNSVVSLPVFIEQRPFGVLVAYSMADDSFYAEELTLLEEITAELATGIELIREKQKSEDTQKELYKLYKAIEQCPVSIVITDKRGLIEYVNPYFTKLTGYTAEEARGKNPRILNAAKSPKEHFVKLWQEILDGNSWSGEFINRTKNGREFIEFAQIAPITDEQGQISHFIGVKEDITQRKELEENLSFLAHHDPLTLLPNRTLFYDRIKQAIALAERNRTNCSLLYIDLNRFKPINDNFGHETGDALLKACAERLVGAVRESDTVARIGGDEFIVLSPVAEPAHAGLLAEKLLSVIEKPFQLDKHRCEIGASIGISLFPQDGDTVPALLKKADQAMYQIKNQGLSGFAYFADDATRR